MKTHNILRSVLLIFFAYSISAQERTTVTAKNSEISDNLDLRAIASIFGEAKDLEDFERQINDPKLQITNLDLNEDNQVDYLRVVESVEGNVHLVIIQAVVGQDKYQDVATIEVEKDQNNQVQIQVVGDVYMYGQDYIYEPVYVAPPVIFNTFWVSGYRPYCSIWYWNYYPTFYYRWTPLPVFRYRNHIHSHINHHHHYNYVKIRRCQRAMALYSSRRSNYLERTAPDRSFSSRNQSVHNRYELDQVRKEKSVSVRNTDSTARTNTKEKDSRANTTSKNNQNSTSKTERSDRNKTEAGASTTKNRNDVERSKSIRTENSKSTSTPRTSSPREQRQNQPARNRENSRSKNEYKERQNNGSSSRRG